MFYLLFIIIIIFIIFLFVFLLQCLWNKDYHTTNDPHCPLSSCMVILLTIYTTQHPVLSYSTLILRILGLLQYARMSIDSTCGQCVKWSSNLQAIMWALAKLQHFNCGHSWSPPTPLCKPRIFILSSLQHDNLRSTCVFVRRPSRLELTTWKYAEINIHGYLQTLSKDIFIRADYAFSALGTIFV